MEMVSLKYLKQTKELMAKADTNCQWGEVTSEQVQEAYRDPLRLGAEFTRFVQNNGRVLVTMTDGIIPPPGGRIQILTPVVDESRPWKDAVKAAGPDTGRDWKIWKVGEQYPPTPGSRPSLKQVVLANFGRTIENRENSEEVLAWGRRQKFVLVPHTPRAIFSAAEYYPDLNQHLGMGIMAVVTLKQCACGGNQCVPGVVFSGAERKANLYRFDAVWFGVWFAFGRE